MVLFDWARLLAPCRPGYRPNPLPPAVLGAAPRGRLHAVLGASHVSSGAPALALPCRSPLRRADGLAGRLAAAPGQVAVTRGLTYVPVYVLGFADCRCSCTSCCGRRRRRSSTRTSARFGAGTGIPRHAGVPPLAPRGRARPSTRTSPCTCRCWTGCSARTICPIAGPPPTALLMAPRAPRGYSAAVPAAVPARRTSPRPAPVFAQPVRTRSVLVGPPAASVGTRPHPTAPAGTR